MECIKNKLILMHLVVLKKKTFIDALQYIFRLRVKTLPEQPVKKRYNLF